MPITVTNPRSACPPGSPICQLFVASAVESLVYLGQSFVQVSDRAKSNPWLVQAVARCRIRICVQVANVFAVEFLDGPCSRQPMPLTSFPAWLGHSIVKPMFINNLLCRFIPLLAWLPAPLGTVLDSLPKCAPRACLTLLKTTSTKRTRRPRRTDSKHPYTASVPHHNPCFSHETSSFAHIQQQFNPPNFVNLFQSQAVTHSVLTR